MDKKQWRKEFYEDDNHFDHQLIKEQVMGVDPDNEHTFIYQKARAYLSIYSKTNDFKEVDKYLKSHPEYSENPKMVVQTIIDDLTEKKNEYEPKAQAFLNRASEQKIYNIGLAYDFLVTQAGLLLAYLQDVLKNGITEVNNNVEKKETKSDDPDLPWSLIPDTIHEAGLILENITEDEFGVIIKSHFSFKSGTNASGGFKHKKTGAFIQVFGSPKNFSEGLQTLYQMAVKKYLKNKKASELSLEKYATIQFLKEASTEFTFMGALYIPVESYRSRWEKEKAEQGEADHSQLIKDIKDKPAHQLRYHEFLLQKIGEKQPDQSEWENVVGPAVLQSYLEKLNNRSITHAESVLMENVKANYSGLWEPFTKVAHKAKVKRAVQDGKVVPSQVLNEYPEIPHELKKDVKAKADTEKEVKNRLGENSYQESLYKDRAESIEVRKDVRHELNIKNAHDQQVEAQDKVEEYAIQLLGPKSIGGYIARFFTVASGYPEIIKEIDRGTINLDHVKSIYQYAVDQNAITQETMNNYYQKIKNAVTTDVNKSTPATETTHHPLNAPNEEGNWEYLMTQRPFSIGTFPAEGKIDWKEDGAKFGTLVYNRPLTVDELYQYELSPKLPTSLVGKYLAKSLGKKIAYQKIISITERGIVTLRHDDREVPHRSLEILKNPNIFQIRPDSPTGKPDYLASEMQPTTPAATTPAPTTPAPTTPAEQPPARYLDIDDISLSNLQKGRLKKKLGTYFRTQEDGTITYDEILKRAVSKGASPMKYEVTDSNEMRKAEEEMAMLQRTAPIGNKEHPKMKRLLDLKEKMENKGFKKTIYALEGKDGSYMELSKNEFVYVSEILFPNQVNKAQKPTPKFTDEGLIEHLNELFDEFVELENDQLKYWATKEYDELEFENVTKDQFKEHESYQNLLNDLTKEELAKAKSLIESKSLEGKINRLYHNYVKEFQYKKSQIPTTTGGTGTPATIDEKRQAVISELHEKWEKGIKVTPKPMREMAEKYGIQDLNVYYEFAELAWTLWYRKILAENNNDPLAAYNHAVDFYLNLQPGFNQSSTTKRIYQQYSTAAPISIMAGWYCNIFSFTRRKGNEEKIDVEVFEPSAGNGLLTIVADYENTTVNEIDPTRLSNLKAQPFKKVMNQDALKPFVGMNKKFDAVLSNPPFGELPEITYDFDGYVIKKMDHLMIALALETMKDDGRAALIIGNHTRFLDNGKMQSHRTFFNWLGRQYYIDDIINIDARKLYNRQGTAFPLRMILISGRKPMPFGGAPQLGDEYPGIDQSVTTFKELQDRTFRAKDKSYQQKETINGMLQEQIDMMKFELNK